MQLLYAISITILTAFILDAINIQANHKLYSFLLNHTRMVPAILFYLSYPILIYLVIINPPQNVYARATLFALAVYGTYHLTNLATLPEFHVRFSMYDTLWGIFLTLVLTWLLLHLTN